MKPIAFLFCEGSDLKVAVINRDKNGIISVAGISSSYLDKTTISLDKFPLDSIDQEVKIEDSTFETVSAENQLSDLKIALLATGILQSNFKKIEYVPILTEPNLTYHIYEGDIFEKKQDSIEALITDISKTRNIVLEKGSIDFVEIADDRLLTAFIEGQVECYTLIKALSDYVSKDQPKINVIKSAEISLAYYVSKVKNFDENVYSIIVYVAKEYSKLIFLKGNQITHLGTTLDVGTKNIHNYDIYFSKILLEMETGNIPVINNIIVCGEDISENLILSFFGTFPEAEINKLEFDLFNLDSIEQAERARISSYAVPLAAAIDYYDNIDKKYSGINLLPKYILEDRKFFQFSWHSLVILPLLFLVTVFFTVKILERRNEIDSLSKQILEKEEIIKNNQTIIDQIHLLEMRVGNFGMITSKLDTLAIGRGLFTTLVSKISDFVASNQNLWLTKMDYNDNRRFEIEGFSTSRNSITNFVNTIEGSSLKSITNEIIRERRIYRFNLTIDISSYLRNYE
jgi:Tfp pilus assembly protein PilN